MYGVETICLGNTMALLSEKRDVNEIVNQSLCNAKICMSRGNFGRAFAHFLLILKLSPSKKCEVKEDFTLATREWTEELEKRGRTDDLFLCYSQASDLFPECEGVLNNIGAQLFRLGYIDEAAMYIRRALKIDPNFLGARENFENICGHLVERWHFRMLNDVTRNQAYRRAIIKAVGEGHDTMLDIGAGTGLLSMFASEAGVSFVFACEKSRTMYEVGEEVLYANGMSDDIKLLCKSSTDLRVPQDLPHRVSLVVTETFDAGLFGEHILSTLKHAWEELLQTPDDMTRFGGPPAKVIPQSAEVYCCAIECDMIWKQNRFVYPALQALDCSGMEIVCDTGSSDNEPYSTENLASVRGGYRQLSDIFPLLTVEFNSLTNITDLLNGVLQQVSCLIRSTGRLDAMAVWFDLHLDGFSTISTCPVVENCWDQAIFPVLPHHMNNAGSRQKLRTREGDRVQVTWTCKDDKLMVMCTGIDRSSECLVKREKFTDAIEISDNDGAMELSVYADAECRQRCTNSVPRTTSNVHSVFSPSTEQNMYSSQRPHSMLDNYLDVPIEFSQTALNYSHSLDMQWASNLNARTLPHSSINRGYGMEDDATPLFHPRTALPSLSLIDMKGASCVSTSIRTILNSTERCLELDAAKHGSNSVESVRHTSTSDLPVVQTLDGNSKFSTSLNCSSASDSSSRSKDIPVFEPSHKSADLARDSQSCPRFCVPRCEIGKLNDIMLNRSYCQALERLLTDLKQSSRCSRTSCKLLEFSHGLSPLSLQALSLGFDEVMVAGPSQPDSDDSPPHRLVFREMMAQNGIHPDRVQFVASFIQELEPEDKASMLVLDLIEPSGVFHQQVLEDLALMQVTCLEDGGNIIPASVSVYGVLVESLDLHKSSVVVGDNWTLGFHVGDVINDFQMTTHVDIDLTVLPHRRLSHPVKLLDLNLNAKHSQYENPESTKSNDSSDCNGVPLYLQQNHELSVQTTECGRLTAIVYWFDMTLCDGIQISTLSPVSHWHQAAVMIKDEILLSADQSVTLKVQLKNSCLDIKVVPPEEPV